MRHQGKPMVVAGQPAAGPVEEFKRLVWMRRNEMARLFPGVGGQAMAERMIAVAAQGYRRLLDQTDQAVDPRSVMNCVLFAAQLGLEAGTDEAYLVPYKGQAQLIVGPAGLIQVAYRSELVRSVVAECVRESDMFEYQLGDPEFIRHRKAEGDRGELTYAYAIVETTLGGRIRKVLTAQDVAMYRKFSKASKGPWFDNTEGMWRKTALKRCLQYAPRNRLLQLALQEDDHGGALVTEGSPVVEVHPTPATGTEVPPREPGED